MKMIIPIALLTLLAVQGNVRAETNNTQRQNQNFTHTAPVSESQLTKRSLRNYTQLAANPYTRNKHYGQKKRYGSPCGSYSGRVFIFDPRRHRWYACSGGRAIASGVAAGGAGYCRDIRRSCRTPVGHFRIIRKGGAGCRSSRYPVGRGGSRMPYCMFFSKYYAVHGSYHVRAANISHGCIRVYPAAAKWLHSNFLFIGTPVIVRSY